MTDPANTKRLLGRSMRFWGFILMIPGAIVFILGWAALFPAMSRFMELTAEQQPTESVTGDMQAGLMVVIVGTILAAPGVWLWARHMRDPSGMEIWLHQVEDDPEIRPELDRLEQQLHDGQLTVIGFETARSRLRFSKRPNPTS